LKKQTLAKDTFFQYSWFLVSRFSLSPKSFFNPNSPGKVLDNIQRMLIMSTIPVKGTIQQIY